MIAAASGKADVFQGNSSRWYTHTHISSAEWIQLLGGEHTHKVGRKYQYEDRGVGMEGVGDEHDQNTLYTFTEFSYIFLKKHRGRKGLFSLCFRSQCITEQIQGRKEMK